MDSFKQFLTEGWFGFGKKKSQFDKAPAHQTDAQKTHTAQHTGGPYGGPYNQRHRNPDGDVKTMHTDTLHTAYNKLRNTKGASTTARYKDLENERQRRGHKPRMHMDFWNDYQKVKPKARIHWKDQHGKQHSGG